MTVLNNTNETDANFTASWYDVEPTVRVFENVTTTAIDIFMEQLALMLNVYYTPVLIALGSVGNIISLIVFYKSKLRLQSTSQYLSALAFSDNLFLCQLLPPWLAVTRVTNLFAHDWYCQLFVYLSYVTSNYSSWLVVAFTVERFVAVVYPLRRNAMCSVKRARHIIASLALIALVVNLPVLRFAKANQEDCNVDELLIDYAATFNVVDTVLSFTLPLTAIIALNAWIMACVYRIGRAQGHLVRQQRQRRNRMSTPTHPPRSLSQRSQQRVTRMLLVVSTVFVILNLPAYAMRILAYTNNVREQEYSGLWAALQQICLLFFNTNFGINFVLYCLTGQNFRRALMETFNCPRRRKLAHIALRENIMDRPARASSMSTSCGCSFNTHTEAACTGIRRCSSVHCPNVVAVEQETEPQASWMSWLSRLCGRRRPKPVIRRWRFDNSRQVNVTRGPQYADASPDSSDTGPQYVVPAKLSAPPVVTEETTFGNI